MSFWNFGPLAILPPERSRYCQSFNLDKQAEARMNENGAAITCHAVLIYLILAFYIIKKPAPLRDHF